MKPSIPGSNISTGNIPTGYQIIKYWVDDPAEYLRYQNGTLDAPVFRYAEALLIYAEAKAELPMDRKVPGKDNVPVIGHA